MCRSNSRALFIFSAFGRAFFHILKYFSLNFLEWNLTAGSAYKMELHLACICGSINHLHSFWMPMQQRNISESVFGDQWWVDIPELNISASTKIHSRMKRTSGRNLSFLNLSRHRSQADVIKAWRIWASFRWCIDRLCSAARLTVSQR